MKMTVMPPVKPLYNIQLTHDEIQQLVEITSYCNSIAERLACTAQEKTRIEKFLLDMYKGLSTVILEGAK